MNNSSRPTRSRAHKAFLRFVQLRRRYVPVSVAVIIVAVLTGILAGTGAWFLKFTLRHLTTLAMSFRVDGGINWYLLFLPVAGILIVGIYQRYIIHTTLEHGSDRLSEALAAHRYKMDARLCYRPLLAAIVTLGMGGSAGAEGPIASAGAAIGSNMARLFGLPPHFVGMMLGCGAGAGIAGIFKAPIGGALYTVEVLKMPMRTLTVMALIVASVCGGMTCYVLTGFSFDVVFLPTSLFSPEKIGWIVALGVFCGLYSIYYTAVMKFLRHSYGRIKNPWVLNITGGVVVGVCLLCFPAFYGEGYGFVTDLVNGRFDAFLSGSIFEFFHSHGTAALIIAAALVALLKVWAAITSNSTGGVAGDFAPTIFAGAFAGAVFALTVNAIFGIDLPVALYALYGCAGAFAGIIHAPLMAMFLVAEMVGNGYGYFLPLMIVSAVSYITVKVLTPLSRYLNHDDIDALLHHKAPAKKA